MDKKIYTLEKFKSRDNWLGSRGLGGSSASAIYNANPYMTPNELYDKIVFGEKHNNSDNSATERGNALEPLIRKEFEYLNKDKFKIINPPKNNWIFRRKDKPFLTASLDGVLVDKETKEKGILEIKTRVIRTQNEVIEWTNGLIPQNYFIQCLHYFMVTGFTYCYLVSHLIKENYETGETEWVRIDIRRMYRKDLENQIKALEHKECKFYQDCQNHIRPKSYINLPILGD